MAGDVISTQIGQIPARVNHFQVGPAPSQTLGQVDAVHTVGHDDVGEEQLHLITLHPPHLERVRPALRLKNPVAQILQEA